jgi:molybdopterin-guanine dinucleotide biosynthesis protein A
MTHQNISCIILAGGKGQRMGGADKGLLQFRNKPLIQHVIESVSAQVDDIVISANRNIEQYQSLGYAAYSDIDYNYDGPLAGIASTIPHCKHDWILIIPCDMPALPDNLVSSMRKLRSTTQLVVVTVNNRPQLVFLLHRDLLDAIRQFLAGNRHSVMQWVDSVQHRCLESTIDSCFLNINTPAQLQI